MRRLLAVLVFALAVVGHLGVAVGEEPTSAAREAGARAGCACKEKCKQCAEKAKADKTTKVEGRQYAVLCRVVEKGEQTVDEQALRLVVVEGAKAKLGTSYRDAQQACPQKEKGECEGRKEGLTKLPCDDTAIELVVTPLSGSRVQLDARVEKRADGVDAADCPFEPAGIAPADRVAQSNIHVHQSVRAMTLGETVTIAYGCKSCDGESSSVIQLTVHEIEPLTPGITPLTKASSVGPAESGEYYTKVYSVADMLEPYAIHKEGAAVEDADFLPIIDTLLTEAGCNWPGQARIRTMARTVSLEIKQTAAGHQAVANLLSAKRASVDVLQEQIRR